MKIHPEKKQGWRWRCKLGPNTHHHDHHTTAMFALNTCSRKSALLSPPQVSLDPVGGWKCLGASPRAVPLPPRRGRKVAVISADSEGGLQVE